MSDHIFQEIDEEVRRERLQKLWNQYGNYILAAVILIVLAVAGYRLYEYYENKKAGEFGAAYEAASRLSTEGKHAEAEAAFAKIAAEGTPGYRVLARMRVAAETGLRDREAGVKAYEAIAADAGLSQDMRDLATVRAGLLLADRASLDEMRSRLEPLTASSKPYRHSARELIALAAWRAGDAAVAKRWFDMIMADADTPTGIRQRVQMFQALAADGKG